MTTQGHRAWHSPHLVAIARRLGWGVGDQAVASLSNFVLGVYVVRTLGAASFGAFSLAFLTYSLILNASRGLSTDPLLVRYSGAEVRALRRAVTASGATALTVGTVAGAVCVLVGLVLPSTLSGAFIALGIGLPGLMLQDSWRFAFFAAGRGGQAMLNDVVWTVLMIGGLLALDLANQITLVNCLLVFGATATAAAVFGLFQTRALPRVQLVPEWLHEHRTLGVRYLLENTVGSGAMQLRALALGAVAGLADVGDVQAASMLLGPFLVVLMGLSQVAVPEAARVLSHGGTRGLQTFCLAFGGVLGTAAMIWAGALLIALPHGLGELLLGSTWVAAGKLVLPLALALFFGCFSVGSGAGLRALGAASRSLNAQFVTCALYLAGGVAGAVAAGSEGTCWAAAATGLVGAVYWWRHLQGGLGERTAGSAMASSRILVAGAGA